MASSSLSWAAQQQFFDPRQPIVSRTDRARRCRGLDGGCHHSRYGLDAEQPTHGGIDRARNPVSSMGGFLLGSILLRRARNMDSATGPTVAIGARAALGGSDICSRMVCPGAAVSVLATDLHPAAAILGRGSRALGVGFALSDVHLDACSRGAEPEIPELSSNLGRGRNTGNSPARARRDGRVRRP